MLSLADTGYEEPYRAYQPIVEETLIIRIGRADDANAITQLYEATVRVVYAYILSIIENPYAAPDLVQETYLYVRRSAHLYEPNGKPVTWLLNIAGKLANDYLRVQKRGASKMGGFETDKSFDRVTEITDRIILKRAFEDLAPKERQVLFLHAAAGLRHREIASYLRMPIAAVRSRYTRSVDKLRKQLYKMGVSL